MAEARLPADLDCTMDESVDQVAARGGPENAEAVYHVADLEQQAAIAKACFLAAPALLSLGFLLGLIPRLGGGTALSTFVEVLIVVPVVVAWAALAVGASARWKVCEVRIASSGPITFVSVSGRKVVWPGQIWRLVRYEHYRSGDLDHFDIKQRSWPPFLWDGSITVSGKQVEEVFIALRAASPAAEIKAKQYDPDPD